MGEIFKGKGSKAPQGKFYFRLRAANTQIILASQAYKNKMGAKTGIASVKKNGTKRSQFIVKKSKKGDPYFVLTAKGGSGAGAVIGHSETYQSHSKVYKGIKSVMTNASSPVVDLA